MHVVPAGEMTRQPPDLDTPALVVDLSVLRDTVRRAVTELDTRGVALRPHAKTHKSARIAGLLEELGARGTTVATLSEAEALVSGGVQDVFVAYPVWAGSPAKAERLRRLTDSCRLRVGIDSEAGATALGAARGGRRLEVLVELDCGDRRTGTSLPRVVPVAAAARRAGLSVVGVFTHGGHSYADPSAAARAAADEIEVLTSAADALRDDGHEISVLSAGSTPTALLSAHGRVTEVRPGTFVFGDRQQVMLGSMTWSDVSLTVATTVVSNAVPGQFVLDAGAKTVGKDRHPLLDGFGHLPVYPEAKVARVYDHHAVVHHDGPPPEVGTVLTLVPNHVCPVVNLARSLVVVDGDRVDQWPVDAHGCNA